MVPHMHAGADAPFVPTTCCESVTSKKEDLGLVLFTNEEYFILFE